MRIADALAGGVAAALLALPAIAASPYDGSYIGTAATFTGTSSGGKGNVCSPMTAPAPLTINNGHATTRWGDGPMEGDVAADGKLVMHSRAAGLFQGQIDAGGVLKGNYQGYCIYSLTWQRRR